MSFLVRLFRFVVWVVILSWGVSALTRLVRWMAGNRAQESDQGRGGQDIMPRRLVRDPICGTHIAESLAIPLRDRGELVHFCSTRCRDEYARTIQIRAANE